MPLLALGASDCEVLHDGWWGQPVNGLSSLAYLAAGAYLLSRGTSQARVVAAALGAVGIGSVLYHGPMPAGAEQVHDWSILALVAAVGVTWGRNRWQRPPLATFALFGAAVAVNAVSRTGEPLCQPDSLLQGHAAWHVLTATAVAWWFAPRRAITLPERSPSEPEPEPEPAQR